MLDVDSTSADVSLCRSACCLGRWFPASLLGGLILLHCLPGVAQGVTVPKFSFEGDEGWVYSRHYPGGAGIGGGYYTGFASLGSQSFQLYRGTGTVSSLRWAKIQKTNVDFTGVEKILFDCQDRGIDGLRLEFWIDNDLVGSYYNRGHLPLHAGGSWGHTATLYDMEIVLPQSYTGEHTFSITLRDGGTLTSVLSSSSQSSSGPDLDGSSQSTYWPADSKYYRIDNIRFEVDTSATVPEPATLLAGLAGITGLGRYLRKRK